MTSTGVFIRRVLRATDSFHYFALMRKARLERSAAMNTPVPAAESQLMVNFAASGFAPGLPTGGVRCTLPSRSGMLQTGREIVPENFDPSSVVSNFTFFNDSFAA